MKLPLLVLTFVAASLAPALPAHAAESVHLYLTMNGQTIPGESTQKSLGRDGSIECLYYEQKTQAGHRFDPMIIRKRIDIASPMLARAMGEGQSGDAVFKFFRPNPNGDGTTQQFYTVTLLKARITAVRQISPDTIDPASVNNPPQEEVTFAYAGIRVEYIGGERYQDGAVARVGVQLQPVGTEVRSVASAP
jgi:type VI secretion system secreted protein Hcp